MGTILAVLAAIAPVHGQVRGSADAQVKESPSTPSEENLLAMPAVGDLRLRIIAPSILEVFLVTTKSPDGRVSAWDFVGDDLTLRLPPASMFAVRSDGTKIGVSHVGFKRRVVYAPLKKRDLRIGNWLYLQLDGPVHEGALVLVTSADATLWPKETRLRARADRLRWSPAIHANQVGYIPGAAKRARIGYYLGSVGELDLKSERFQIVYDRTGKVVFQGPLKVRADKGWTYSPAPYQRVLEADFTAFQTPGKYRLLVEGLGSSLPFRIDEGTAAAFARTYALGLYHQRCGAENALPFTRFVHKPCHTDPADVPTDANRSVSRQLAGESSNYKDNPRHKAPQLKAVSASLYPFVRQGKVDVSGGHHDAGDYSKYTINSAHLIHTLVFAADAFPGAGDLDNLGIPESGDGKSDLLQMAKWEADFLAKMQDEDGGFYFLVYPRDRAYEQDVLPDHGDPQVVFPKTTAVTAAAVAALAQMASSPRCKAQFPDTAARYLAAAQKGWAFLERAWQRFGMDGSYQKITHYGDFAMHDDEIAWAAAELFLATGENKYHDKLRAMYDPEKGDTRHWGWERLFQAYGCAVRSYAFAEKTGRAAGKSLDQDYVAKCRREILAAGKDAEDWSRASAYGTSFPTETKRFRAAGWYFSTAQAFDIAVANLLDPQPQHSETIWDNIGYEAGCNPTNVVFVTGLGTIRQHEIVHQYATNDRRDLPPSGIPLGSVQEGFMYLDSYKKELGAVTYPPDGVKESPYPFYDRWGDSFNVTTEFTIPIQGRCLAVLCGLMAQSPLKAQPWRAGNAKVEGLPASAKSGSVLNLRLSAPGLDLTNAVIVWESDQQPTAIGATFRFTLASSGAHWVEAEAQLPDGRRVFAVAEFTVR